MEIKTRKISNSDGFLFRTHEHNLRVSKLFRRGVKGDCPTVLLVVNREDIIYVKFELDELVQ